MFPEIVNIEDIPIIEEQTEIPVIKTSFLFDFKTGEFVMRNGRLVKVNGIASLQVWIEKTLRTELDRFKVYEGTDYGTSLEDLIGQNYPISFFESEIQREVNESILKHPVIASVTAFELDKDKASLHVKFTVNLVSGVSYGQELTYNV